MNRQIAFLFVLLGIGFIAFNIMTEREIGTAQAARPITSTTPLAIKLAHAAIDRTRVMVRYDPSYVTISYPMGDVPPDRGVCSDVVVRSYRRLGIDLQRLVHEDMSRAFGRYPRRWGLKQPDRNIDHRRVPNLRVFFTRHGHTLPISSDGSDYRPGDLVTWDLTGDMSNGQRAGIRPGKARLPHIGIVTDRMSADGRRPLIVHNIGRGPQLEDMLFSYRITGHYRYLPTTAAAGGR